MNIKSGLTGAECERFRRECNFTEDELLVFNERVRGRSIVQISLATHMSERTVDRRLRGIKNKIDRTI